MRRREFIVALASAGLLRVAKPVDGDEPA